MKNQTSSLIAFYNSHINPKEKINSAEKEGEHFFKTLSLHASQCLKTVPQKDLESFFNLVLIHAIDLESFPIIIQNIVKAFQLDDALPSSVKLPILCNMYNKASEAACRLTLFRGIVQVAAKSNEMDIILSNIVDVDAVITELDLSNSDTAALYLLLSNSLEKKQELCYSFLLKYLEKMDSSSPSDEVKKNAQKAVKLAITCQSVLTFRPLLSFKSVKALGATPSVDLLTVLNGQSMDDFKSCVRRNPSLLKELGITEADCLRKIRLLSLLKLANMNIRKSIEYKSVAVALDVPLDQVEFWIVDGIRSKLIDAKLDQLKSSVFISRSSLQSLDSWDGISNKLASFVDNLDGCLKKLEDLR